MSFFSRYTTDELNRIHANLMRVNAEYVEAKATSNHGQRWESAADYEAFQNGWRDNTRSLKAIREVLATRAA